MSSNPPSMPAAEVRQARRARTRTIRRRVATGAAALFLATWALIAVELVSGRDPALASRKTTTVATSSAQPAASTATTSGSGTDATTTDDSSTSSTGSSVSNNSSGSSAVSSVTTRQS